MKTILFQKLDILFQMMNLLIHIFFEIFVPFHHQLEILIFYVLLRISKSWSTRVQLMISFEFPRYIQQTLLDVAQFLKKDVLNGNLISFLILMHISVADHLLKSRNYFVKSLKGILVDGSEVANLFFQQPFLDVPVGSQSFVPVAIEQVHFL